MKIGRKTFAIIRQNFLDMRFLIQRSLSYSVFFFFLVILYIFLLISIEYLLQGKIEIAAPVGAGITILIGIYTLPFIEVWFRNITDPFLFKEEYNYFVVLEKLSDVLNSNLNLRPLVLQSLAVLRSTFKPTYIYFVRTDSSECFSHDDCTCSDMIRNSHAEEVRISISSHSISIGEYVLGPRRSGEPYSCQDISLLRTFGSNATVAFEKAELFRQLREYTNLLEERVEERTQYLKELQDHQREFFNNITHALQTPLTVLRSGVEILSISSTKADSRIHSTMKRSVDDLARLTRSILELACIDTYLPKDNISGVDLSALTERLAENVRIVAQARGILFISHIASDVLVNGRERQLEEAVTNILSNAVKYTSGCARKEVSLSLERSEDGAILAIADTGIGMSPADRERVFGRFYRAPTGKEGYGLGLAIAKRIIDQHEGTITIESEPGRGTTVRISIPCLAQESVRS